MNLLHNAPPVVYPVGRSRFLGVTLWVLWLAGIVLAAGAGWHGHLPGARSLVVGAAVLLAGLQAWRFWGRLPSGSLRWDGAAWWFESVAATAPALPGELRVHLDLQRYLLLAWRVPTERAAGEIRLAPWSGAGRWDWLWVDARFNPQHWHELRCAVYSFRAKTDVPDGASDP